MMITPQRGITLLVSVILTSVILSVALALFDITYKQVVLASSARQSQVAYYSADSAMECALYWDQQKDAFDYTTSAYETNTAITCNGQSIQIYTVPNTTTKDSPSVGYRTTVFSIPSGSGILGKVTIYKQSTGATQIFATGYSTNVTTDPRRIERGLTVTYGTFGGGGTRVFTISPAVGGFSTWDLDVQGPLVLSTPGTWTINPSAGFTATVKLWGAGGGGGVFSTNGAGGYAGGTVSFTPAGHTVYVGDTIGSPGGGAAGTGHGGGYSELKQGGAALLIAGGGGGGGFGGNGGAGGGAIGQDGTSFSGDGTQGHGGTGSSGGAGGAGGGGAGSSLQGGAGGGAGSPGGGGGGGYFGGGGGGYAGGGGAGGGGGGSSYFNGGLVSAPVLTAGNGTTPGNSGDPDRGSAGNPSTSGAVIIK